MGPFGVGHDEQAMLELLKSSQPQDNVLLASGYFNLTDHYMSVILEQSRAKFSILMASPQVNKSRNKRFVKSGPFCLWASSI